MDWHKEREQWTRTCQKLQQEVYLLQSRLQKHEKETADKIAHVKAHYKERLAEKDRLIEGLGQLVHQLKDDMLALEIEINSLKTADNAFAETTLPGAFLDVPTESLNGRSPSEKSERSVASDGSFLLCSHFTLDKDD